MNKNIRTELKMGITLFALYLVLNRFSSAPDFIIGFLAGLSLFLEVIGFLPEKAYQKMKNLKRTLFKI